MTAAPPPQITELLRAWSAGDQSAVEQIVELTYPELRRIARRHLSRERPGHSLQASALVNEAYLRLVNARQVQWKDRAHFLAIGARIMRRILIDYARGRPKAARTELTETLAISPGLDLDLVVLDQALKALAEFDERKAKVVEMQFMDFIACGFDQIVNMAAKIHYRWGAKVPMVIRGPSGAGVHGGLPPAGHATAS